MSKIEKNRSLTSNQIVSDLKGIIFETVNVPQSSISNSTNLQEHLGIDSFNAIEILVAIEQKYGITIDPLESFKIRTFKDMIDLTKQYLEETK